MVDNIIFSTTTGSVTTASEKAGTTAVYEPLKDEESKYAQAQAVYETPQESHVQDINKKQVRILICTHKVILTLLKLSPAMLIYFSHIAN